LKVHGTSVHDHASLIPAGDKKGDDKVAEYDCDEVEHKQVKW
jgi:hypothetical protein